jgi:hypothetical protein
MGEQRHPIVLNFHVGYRYTPNNLGYNHPANNASTAAISAWVSGWRLPL